MGCTCITYHFVTYKLLNIDEWLWSFSLNSRTLAFIVILYSFHVRLHLFDCHICIIIIICNVENIYLSGISSQSEIGKDVGRGGDSGGRTFSGTTTGGGETKPTLPVTPPAGFKLMQDPFTGQLFIIPGTFPKQSFLKKQHTSHRTTWGMSSLTCP